MIKTEIDMQISFYCEPAKPTSDFHVINSLNERAEQSLKLTGHTATPWIGPIWPKLEYIRLGLDLDPCPNNHLIIGTTENSNFSPRRLEVHH